LKKVIATAIVCLCVARLAAGESTKLSLSSAKTRSVSITVSPTAATLDPGQSTSFAATVVGSRSPVRWRASCGTIDSRGRYTAPASAATCGVTATVDSVTSTPAIIAVTAPEPTPAPTPTPTPAPAPQTSTPVSATGEAVISVTPGPGALETALAEAVTAVRSGPVTVVLAPGDYPGNFVLPRTGSSFGITITAAAAQLPPAGARMTLAYQGSLPRLVPTQLATTTLTVTGDNYTLRGLQVETPGVGVTTIDVVGDTSGNLPRNVTFDQMLIRGNQTTGGHRGVGMNGVNIAVTNSWIDRMWEVGRDAQAAAAWDTPGPLTIENNYLEASGENFLLGGAIPTCGCVPTDVIFTRNTVRKDPAWRTMAEQPTVKNLLEIKYGRRVFISGNTFEYNWLQAQTGWSILFIAKGIDGTAWTVVEDVTFTRNIVRRVANGLNIAAVEGPVRRVRVEQNVWQDIDMNTWGGDGRWAIIQTGVYGADDIVLERNTVLGLTGNQFLGLYGSVPLQRFAMTHVVVEHRDYGVHSTSGLAADALAVMAPGGRFSDNALTGPDAYWLKWPNGNFTVDVNVSDQFDARYAIKPGSPLAGLSTSDAVPVGADPSVLPQ